MTEPIKLIKWSDAPDRTSWGASMRVVDIEIDKDHTLTLFCEASQTAKVDAMFAEVERLRAELERLTTLFGEPVAWQERLSDSEGGWGYWYESHDRTIDDPLEEVSPGGLRIQWRPLYARAALKETK
jgi:hypothetical protein